MNAQRTYRPEGVSVANWDVKTLSQEQLWNLWKWGEDEKIDARSFADSVPLCQAIKIRSATLTAQKRQGRLVITATL